MQNILARSPGKLNLTFDILGLLPGGYHEVETLMQTVDLADELTFTIEESDDFSIEIAEIKFADVQADVPKDSNNLVIKAANLFKDADASTIPFKVTVRIKKGVPVAGGMGGGSGNAAATLLLLNKITGNKISDVEIKTLASRLGADVPFFIDGGTQIGSQRGDILEKVNGSRELNFLIVGPTTFGLQTADVYRAYDEDPNEHNRVSAANCVSALGEGNLSQIGKSFGNTFEPVVFARRPELAFIAQRLESLGGYCTRLTGSGPTLYTLTRDTAESINIQEALADEQQKRKFGWENYPKLSVQSWVSSSTHSGVIFEHGVG